MYKVTYTSEDQEDGNPDSKETFFVNTSNPYAAVVATCRHVGFEGELSSDELIAELAQGKSKPITELMHYIADDEALPHNIFQDIMITPCKCPTTKLEFEVPLTSVGTFDANSARLHVLKNLERAIKILSKAYLETVVTTTPEEEALDADSYKLEYTNDGPAID